MNERDVFHALGDPTRLAIVERLGRNGPMTTVPLLDGLGMSRQAASKHLHVLERAGLVASRVHGRMVVRELQLEAIAQGGDWLLARAAAWERRLDRLQQLVELSITDDVDA